ncbi:hypothetical protein ACFQ6N_26160 [Kitasatospora sp. NPDC056446]|uniref:hypothetical protein n=1 Tax=Kitasatospora sp. NPDC056446 TaxID=3345819 RepID=UPI0036AEE969
MSALLRTRGPRAAADVRLLRAVVLATVSVALAAAAHTVAGGRVGAGPLAAGWLLVACAGAAGAGRRRSLPAITGVFGAGQLGLHLLFRTGVDVPAGGPARRSGTAAGAHGHLNHPGAVAGAAHSTAHSGLLGHSPAMAAAHLAAALATGWLLHRVEVALWRLLGMARALRALARRWRRRFAAALARLLGPAGAAVPGPGPGPVPVAGGGVAGPSAVLRYSVVRRGPPGAAGA